MPQRPCKLYSMPMQDLKFITKYAQHIIFKPLKHAFYKVLKYADFYQEPVFSGCLRLFIRNLAVIHEIVKESRPRTLLLAAGNCSLGCALGFYYGAVNIYNLAAAFFIVITGVLLQVLANLANDYGDALKGSDGEGRLGPIRGAMTGAVSLGELKRFMGVVIVVLCATGITAVLMTLGNNGEALAWFIFVGGLSVCSAICYTVGPAYGYKSLGDIFVFIFFGCVAVIGPQIMLTNAAGLGLEVYPDSFMLSLSVGFSSVMVLHVANMRDISEDIKHGKKTLASRLGYKGAAFLMLIFLLCTVVFSFAACFTSHKGWQISILFLSLLPLSLSTFRIIKNCKDERKIAPELKSVLIGCTVHCFAWIIVLPVDFWVYF